MNNSLFELTSKIKKQDEEYTDSLPRLFPTEFNTADDFFDECRMVKTITFQVTDDCNMACTYCYQICKKHHFLSFETAKIFIDKLLDLDNPLPYANYKNARGLIIEFIGGEPFLAINLIRQICDYMTQQMIEKDHPWLFRHRFSICSNGLLYFEPEVQDFISKYANRLSFSISIDGNKELHDACRVDRNGAGTYDRAITAVKHFREHYHGYIGSKMTIAPGNVSFIAQAAISLIENGYKNIYLNCVYEKGWEDKHATMLYYELTKLADYVIDNKLYDTVYLSRFDYRSYQPMHIDENSNWCGGVDETMLSIDYKGDMYPCVRYMESSLGTDQPPMIIGNIEQGIYATPEQEARRKELTNVTRRCQSTDECFYCPVAQGCGWCSAYNYQEFGTVRKRTTYHCMMHKAESLANAYFWNKLCSKEQLRERFKIWLPKEDALKIISEKEYKLLKELEGLEN